MRKRHKTSHQSLQVRLDDLLEYEPITRGQEVTYQAWDDDYNLVLTGSAGTGKTFMGMYLGLEQVLDPTTEQERLVIVRSMVPTRDMGFLPGTKEEKEDVFLSPYKNIANELFGDSNSYNRAVTAKKIEFQSTSFIRGLTLDNCVILVDEMQNMNFHELDSVITRVGKNCRIIFAGDYLQSDFKFKDEKDGIMKFLTIVEQLKKFEVITFGWEDIVRSDFVRDYIMTKEMLGITT
jgi:phosphate starvation-inducible PhoH-like protein|tara:strand:+ start:445 stop:1149 length:705 start_codon:yes stop_codon:yes gene_type:complete